MIIDTQSKQLPAPVNVDWRVKITFENDQLTFRAFSTTKHFMRFRMLLTKDGKFKFPWLTFAEARQVSNTDGFFTIPVGLNVIKLEPSSELLIEPKETALMNFKKMLATSESSAIFVVGGEEFKENS